MLRLQTRISTCIRSVATRIHAYAYPQKAKRAAFPACKRIFVSPCSIAHTSRHRFRRIVFQSFSRHSTKHTVGEPGHTEKQHKVVRNVSNGTAIPNDARECLQIIPSFLSEASFTPGNFMEHSHDQYRIPGQFHEVLAIFQSL